MCEDVSNEQHSLFSLRRINDTQPKVKFGIKHSTPPFGRSGGARRRANSYAFSFEQILGYKLSAFCLVSHRCCHLNVEWGLRSLANLTNNSWAINSSVNFNVEIIPRISASIRNMKRNAIFDVCVWAPIPRESRLKMHSLITCERAARRRDYETNNSPKSTVYSSISAEEKFFFFINMWQNILKFDINAKLLCNSIDRNCRWRALADWNCAQ